jgi:hypothetical protein
MSSQDTRRPTSSPWDQAFLIGIFSLFAIGTIKSLSVIFGPSGEYQYPDDWDPADAPADIVYIGDAGD